MEIKKKVYIHRQCKLKKKMFYIFSAQNVYIAEFKCTRNIDE